MAKIKPRSRKVGTSKRKKQRRYCDRLVTEIYTGKPCEVCPVVNMYLTCGHHVVAKSLSAYYRHDPENIVVLCPSHHTMGVEIAPHSKWQPAVAKFIDWLRTHRPKSYEILMNYKSKRGVQPDYEEAIEKLRKLGEQK